MRASLRLGQSRLYNATSYTWLVSSVYLFDLDGTLIDRLPSLKRFLPEQYARYCNADTVSAESFVARFLELDGAGHTPKHEIYETLVYEFGLNASVPELIADFRQNAFKFCQPQQDTLRVLGQLRQWGVRLGVITNGSTAAQEQKLKASGIAELVAFSLISEAVGIRKPDPEIFLEAARRFDVISSSCTFVGDHPEKDIVGAQSVGMRTVWLRHGRTWFRQLRPPTFAVAGLEELLTLRTR